MREVVKKEVIKLLDARIIYRVLHSEWVSPVHCVPKKGGLTVVKNEKNEMIPQRTVTGWRMCIDYRSLTKQRRKISSPTVNRRDAREVSKRRLFLLSRWILGVHANSHSPGRPIFTFSMDTRGSCKFPFTRTINIKQRSHALMERLHIEGCPSVYATLWPLLNVA
jgi:hypothetical protein